jgi:hypothetical protein
LKIENFIIVTGMHRSGTSIITKSLEAIGCQLGSDNFIPTIKKSNEFGFFEDKDFNALNIEIMKSLNISWHSPQFKIINNSSYSSILIEKGISLIKKKLDMNINVLKDPVASLFLGYWFQVFQKCNINLHVIECIRNPLAVALSLKKRDDFNHRFSFYLYNFYNFAFIENKKRFRFKYSIIDYDNFLKKPEIYLFNLANVFEYKFQKEKVSDFLNIYIKKSLNHFENSNFIKASNVSQLSSKIYKYIKKDDHAKIGSLNKVRIFKMIDEIIYKDLFKKFKESSYYFDLFFQLLNNQINSSNIEYKKLESYNADLISTIEDNDKEYRKLEKIIKNNDKEYRKLEKIIKNNDKEYKKLESYNADLISTIEDNDKEYRKLEKIIKNKDKEYRKLERNNADLTTVIKNYNKG